VSDKFSDDLPTHDIGTAGEIDAVVDSAADQAAQLGREVGVDPQTSGAPEPGTAPSGGEQVDNETVDDQLDEIESLLGSAADDLGAGDDQARDTPGTTETEHPAGSVDEQVGADAGTVGPAPRDDAGPDAERLSPDVPVDGIPAAEFDGAPTTDGTELSELDAAADGPTVRDGHLLDRITYGVLDVLDHLDRPFGWVGDHARRLVGWVALATLLTAACIWVLASLD